jgi:hypothetical protein
MEHSEVTETGVGAEQVGDLLGRFAPHGHSRRHVKKEDRFPPWPRPRAEDRRQPGSNGEALGRGLKVDLGFLRVRHGPAQGLQSACEGTRPQSGHLSAYGPDGSGILDGTQARCVGRDALGEAHQGDRRGLVQP